MKSRAVVSLLAYTWMIGVNAAANLIPINGLTTGQVSSGLNLIFAPAAYVFSIWGLIYTLLLGFLYFQFTSGQPACRNLVTISNAFIVSCLLNAAWIFSWHYLWFIASLVIIAALLATLGFIYARLDTSQNPFQSWQEKYLLNLPFQVYSAWMAIAFLSNVNVVIKTAGGNMNELVWALISVAAAVAAGSYMVLRRREYIWGLVFGWALVGIAVAQKGLSIVFYSTLGSVLFIAAAMIWIYRQTRC